MNHSELLLKFKDKLTPDQGFAYNETTVARQKKLLEDSQPFNIWPVTISSRKETPLGRDYPYTVPSTSPKIDNRPDQSIINNPNNYFPISEFKIRLRNLFSKKN